MTKLRAATVSTQPVRRPRKRKQPPSDNHDDTEGNSTSQGGSHQTDNPVEIVSIPSAEVQSATASTTTVPTKAHDGGKKPRRAPASKTKPALKRNNSSKLETTEIPWPDHFTRLAKTHRALNLVYTFCCTRRQLATTFENLRSAIEGHIGRDFEVQEVAQLVVLLPRAIRFEYVDEALLSSLADEGGDARQARKEREMDAHFNKGQRRSGLTLANGSNVDPSKEVIPKDDDEVHEVLLIEYLDGDLKRQVIDPKTGQPTKAFQKLRNEDLKMPVYSQKQLMNLIEKRNNKFTSAVNGWLNRCAEEKVDPVEKLLAEKDAAIPVESSSRGSTPAPVKQSAPPPTIPAERKTISEIVNEIKDMEWYTAQIVPDGHRVFDPQEPVFGELEFALSQNLVNALYNTRNITQLYSHQAEAINNLYNGHHVIVSTSTSSGKSLIYQIPMLHELEKDPESRGMYIFPTKALAQDQRRSMKDLLQFMPGLEDIVVETFDGDTPMQDRNYVRNEGRIIFTNPDMLHITILPQESAWRTFLQNLRFVVVDELHVYNGLFGAHMAFIMRRLRRICAAVGNHNVKFVSCSATVANPEDHMKTIFGIEDVRLTDFDGSPSGRKEFVCWNTPFKDPNDPTSGRGDTHAETARLFCQLILRGVRVIAFCRIRKQCEILIGAVRTELQTLERPEAANRVMAYRGGYNPQDRRRIEKEMFEGKLLGIVATTALELGVDIGSLDAVITMGFPYTIANLRQQSGRAGRRNKDSLSVLVGDCFPTDQHYMANPDEIFTKPNCELQVDLTNELVLEGHIQCAAYEAPIHPVEDKPYFGELLPSFASSRLITDGSGYYHTHSRFRPKPAKFVAIRDTEDDSFAVVDISHDRNMVLEEVEASRAFFTIYEGGIFLHQGRTYLVKEFRPEERIAKVVKVNVDWITQQRDYTDIDPVETESIRIITPRNRKTKLPRNQRCKAYFGPILIHAVVYGFFKLDKKRRILDAVTVDNPPIDILSKGMWLDIPRGALELLASRHLNIAAAIHAAEHAILSLMPSYVISMPGDVKTECKIAKKEFMTKQSSRKRPARLTFYDAKGGAAGSGIARKAFEFIDLLLERAVERVAACHCMNGCYECVCAEYCHQQNEVIGKAGAGVILMALLGRLDEVDVESLPWGEDEETVGGIREGTETVVLAREVKGKDGRFLRPEGEEEGDDEIVVIKVEDEEEVVFQ